MEITKSKIWLIPCPGVGLRGVLYEFWWKGILLIRKTIYRDLNKKCYIDWFVGTQEILLRS